MPESRMDTTPNPVYRHRRWLPYWAVLQTDLRQTLRSWAYLLWVAVSILATGGYLLYRFGVHAEYQLQNASSLTGDLLRWLMLGSLSLIVVLTVSSISSERGTLADSVLSRGISRYQYFLAKWHSRLLVIMVTFTLLFAGVFFGGYLLFKDDLTVGGGMTAILVVGAMLMAVVSCGVTIGALTSSTVLGITLLWIGLYGAGFLLAALPEGYIPQVRNILHIAPTDKQEQVDSSSRNDSTGKTPKKNGMLPRVLRGDSSIYAFDDLFLMCGGLSLFSAGLGMVVFSRKDV
jgi:ABC-2 type transport system permease protein